ncbi:MAG TPA: type I-D CRISPR-associated protein Cas5/Csc1, partial [Thermotogota bacterium]|nr:type I-D CRISPR-associated protein Cas5/Csc1 [Thermotogota bacterium]
DVVRTTEPFDPSKGPRARNSPQWGKFKMITPESQAIFFWYSPEKLEGNRRYLRLGKHMSKCRVELEELPYESKTGKFEIDHPINPLDLHPQTELLRYKVLSVKPSPLLGRGKFLGPYLQTSKESLPAFGGFFAKRRRSA